MWLVHLEAVMTHKVVKRGPAYPEQFGRLRHIAFRAGKGAGNFAAFGLFAGLDQIDNVRNFVCLGEIKIRRHDAICGRELRPGLPR